MVWVCVLLKVHPSVLAQVKLWLHQSEARCAVKFMLRTSEVRLVIPSIAKGGPPPLTLDKGRLGEGGYFNLCPLP